MNSHDRSENADARLSRIETHWSLVRQAHDEEDSQLVVDAKQQLLMRYSSAIRRYALAAMRDSDAADEVVQEFAVKFVRGDLRAANPDAGRFRQFVKTVIYRLIVDHYRRRPKEQQFDSEATAAETLVDHRLADADEALLLAWRDELLDAAWAKLDEYSTRRKAIFALILRARADNADWSAEELAAYVAAKEGKPMNANSVRVALHRARQRFAELLLDTIADSLEDSSDFDSLESEVVELRLLDYCRDALESRRRQRPEPS